jgi:Metallo-peptidase family M12
MLNIQRCFRAARPCAAAIFFLESLVAATQIGHTQTVGDGLHFFKNYFVTGGSVTGNVDFGSQSGGNGFVTGVIPISGVPQDADIVGAFLYWETIAAGSQSSTVTGAHFHGFDISSVTKQIGFRPLTATYAPCWSSGGGSNTTFTMATYRTDVLRFLPIGDDPTKLGFGKRLANSADLATQFPDVSDPRNAHTVTLPEAGTGNQVPQTAGSSLVIIYRDTRDDVSPAAGVQRPPLTSVVVFDGLDLQALGATTTATIKGFYLASSPTATATLTTIVGSGAKNATESLSFNSQPIATNPFIGVASPGSDRGWDSPTFDISNLIGQSTTTAYGQQADVSITHDNGTPYDCLNETAVILNTTVQDADNDGIVDSWESSETSGSLLDPNGVLLPDLYAMGARTNQQDLFVEIGRTVLNEAYVNPFQGNVSPHDHMPSAAALAMVGDAFKRAPVSIPNGSAGIAVHFDVGNHYQDGIATNPAAPYIIPFKHADGSACTAPDASDHTFDVNCLARGGEAIVETACVPSASNNFHCQFPGYRGVVGWKTGFRFLRDQSLDDLSTPADESNCTAAPNTCSRRFDRNRKDIFHYALFPHALGVQRLDDPNTPADESVAGNPATPVPVGVSGTGDGGGSGGGDLMVTLGFWDNFVGTDFQQASTLMHELGHNFGLRHGPTYVSNGLLTVQNCQPNYESVMNYAFQVHGLTVKSLNVPVGGFQPNDSVIDYSREVLPGVNETTLNESTGLGTMNYATAWHVNRNATLLASVGSTALRRHCDGSFLSSQEFLDYSNGNGMVRVESSTRTAPIDWNMNGTADTGVSQDITFNGVKNTLSVGPNDWTQLDLRQVGSRRNVASHAIIDAVGPLSLDQGQGDNGQGDNGQGDNGQGDNGQGDNGQGDNGQGDNGQGDNGQGDNGSPPEVDFESAADAPHLQSLTIIKQPPPQGILVKWSAPHVGKVFSYDIWRSEGTTITPQHIVVGTVLAPTTAFLDTSVKKSGVPYTYFVTANVLEHPNSAVLTRTGISNSGSISFK